MNTLVSTSIEIPTTCHMSPTLDDAYMKLVSHEYASGISSPSCGPYSSSLPISHSDEDIKEAMSTLDYLLDDM